MERQSELVQMDIFCPNIIVGKCNAQKCRYPVYAGNTHDENGGFVFFKDIEGFRQRNLPVFGKYTDEYLTLCNTESLDKIKESMRNSHLLLARSKVFAERNAEIGRKTSMGI